VRVETIFHVADEQQAQAVATRMVDRAHEIANLPECECDLDVAIERIPPGIARNRVDGGDASVRGRPTKH
jgi:hypothetical protein